MQGSELLSASCTSSSESRASIEEGSASNRCDRGHRHDPCARCHHRSVRWKQVAAAGRARGGPIKIPAYGENTVSVCTAALLPLHAPTCHTYFGANLWPPVQIGKLMNKNVAEAARRVFGNLPHSKVRSGNKALRKNIIGRKIAEYYPQSTAPDMVKMAEREIPGVVMDHKKEWRQQKRDLDEGTKRGAPASKKG